MTHQNGGGGGAGGGLEGQWDGEVSASLPLASWGPHKESPQVATRAYQRDQRARLPPSGGIGQNGPLVECLVDTRRCLIWLSLQPSEGGAHKGLRHIKMK